MACNDGAGASSSSAHAACAADDQEFHFQVVIVGAGAAGIGVAHAMLKGGMLPTDILLVERGEDVGSSFREWHPTTRFISPSFASYPFGPQDLNAVVPDTAVHATSNGGQHPTGIEYAEYLERMMVGTGLLVELENTIIKVEYKAGRPEKNEQDVIVLYTSNGNMILCNHLVWAAGDWDNPTRLPTSKFPNDASVHYKRADLDELVESVENTDDPIVLVGSGEAGADLASALVGKGARNVLILEKQQLDSDPNLDPSRRLSPVTQDRLGRIADHVETKWGSEVTSVKKDGKKNKIQVKYSNGETTTISTLARVVLCTGFNVSTSELWNSMFDFVKGSPQVNEFDESTKVPNVFLSGPMLFHKLTFAACKAKDEHGNEGNGENGQMGNGKHNGDVIPVANGAESEQVGEEPDCDDNDTIIFCFIYKFRTRFAVVAGEIIRRIARDKFINSQGKLQSEGEEMMGNADEMQKFYLSKGMLVTDLSCSNLACGMTTNDRPDYGYVFSDEEDDEEEEEDE